MDAEATAKGEEAKKVDEHEVRKIILDRLHALMDKHLNEREFRLKKAVSMRNTTMQWDLIAAAVEEANIELHGLTGKEAWKMSGRSKITFQKKQNDILQSDDAQDDNDDFDNKVKWLKKIAGQHAKLGNKLIATAKRVKAARDPKDEGLVNGAISAAETNKKRIRTTIHSYIMLAGEQAKKHQLSDDQTKTDKDHVATEGAKSSEKRKWTRR